MVPVIVNAILNEHQIVVDIVAFVNRGDFPRSRLGEKQRGKILAGWVTRKLRTMAQFSIRDMSYILDPHGGSRDFPASEAHRGSIGSIRSSGVPGSSSLRNVEPAPRILEQRELEQYVDDWASMKLDHKNNDQGNSGGQYGGTRAGNPTEVSGPSRANDLPDFEHIGSDDFMPQQVHRSYQEHQQPTPHGTAGPAPLSAARSQGVPQIHLPSVDGRETDWQGKGGNSDDETDWTKEAVMHMNLAGAG